MPNCLDCPSYMGGDEASAHVGRPMNGVSMCKRFGHALSVPSSTEDEMIEVGAKFADKCASFGEPAPARFIKPLAFDLFNPSPSLMADALQGVTDGITKTCVSCQGCKFSVPMQAMHDEQEIPLPGCAAKGLAILDTIRQAASCDMGVPGMSTDAFPADMEPRAHFRPGYIFQPDRKVNESVGTLSIEPTDYETDAPVSFEDTAEGIRAWRKIVDPHGSDKYVMLPIFDRDFFPAEERSFIPTTGDDHHPELYVDYANLLWHFAVDAWSLNETLVLQSDPGLGKTEFTYWLAWLMQLPHRRVAFNGTTEYDEVFGKMLYSPEKGGTYWQNGRYTRAWKSYACILNVDEPNLASNSIIESLRTTTDTDRMLYLDGAVSEDAEGSDDERRLMIKPGPYVFQIWCMNPSWDIRNLGAKELANADVDRLTPIIVPYPDATLEKHIIKERCKLDGFEPTDEQLNVLIKVAEDIREFAKNGDFPGSWGMRQQIKVARKLAFYDFEEAYRVAAFNYYEPETADFIMNSIRTQFPASAKTRTKRPPVGGRIK